jgi:hypothetical protein
LLHSQLVCSLSFFFTTPRSPISINSRSAIADFLLSAFTRHLWMHWQATCSAQHSHVSRKIDNGIWHQFRAKWGWKGFGREHQGPIYCRPRGFEFAICAQVQMKRARALKESPTAASRWKGLINYYIQDKWLVTPN